MANNYTQMNYLLFLTNMPIQELYFLSSMWYSRTMRLRRKYDNTDNAKAHRLIKEMTARLQVLTNVIGYTLIPTSTRHYIAAGYPKTQSNFIKFKTT